MQPRSIHRASAGHRSRLLKPASRWSFLFAITAFLAMAGSLLAVPPAVEKRFAELYPDVEPKGWEVDINGNWEAGFTRDSVDYRADFTPEGVWVETESNLKVEELPDAVQRAIKLDFGNDEIAEIERVEHPEKGIFFDVELKRDGKNQDIEYDEDGNRQESILTVVEELQAPVGNLAMARKRPEDMGKLELAFEFGFNLLTIVIFAWFIYYRRHHDHKMFYLLLGFNLFLFPIFLLSTSLTAGFGFTIFALLALVRMRSDTFSKTEVAYLLGAVALTFINAMLTARVEIVSSIIVLATAWLGDHPRIWRDAYHSVQIRYRMKDTEQMLNQDFLRERIAEDFQVEVNEIDIERVAKNEVRLVVMYRDLPDIRKARKGKSKRKGLIRKKTRSDSGKSSDGDASQSPKKD